MGLVEENAGDLGKANPAIISKWKVGLHPPASFLQNSELGVKITNRMRVWNWAEESTKASDFSLSFAQSGVQIPPWNSLFHRGRVWMNAPDAGNLGIIVKNV